MYFLLAVGEAILGVSGLFLDPGYHIFTQVVMTVIFLIALFGLFEYVFHERFVPRLFWQYFLGIYILIDIIYLIYALFPTVPILSSLSFLTIYKDDNNLLINAIAGVAIDIPLLYAMYRLTKEQVYPEEKKVPKHKTFPKWGMIQMALWGYSFVISVFLFIASFFMIGGGNSKATVDTYSFTFIVILFVPMVIFWLWVILQYKMYRWNWWRTTLVANGLFYSGSLIYGVLAPSISQSGASGFDYIISILQLFILLASLYVFGREQIK